MPPRRRPINVRVRKELDLLCKTGIIEPVTAPTPWISALPVTNKSNGDIRICIVPKYLNSALKRSIYTMPTIADVLPQLKNAKIFSIADARYGFINLSLDDESASLTTFEKPFGHYRWRRLFWHQSSARNIPGQDASSFRGPEWSSMHR